MSVTVAAMSSPHQLQLQSHSPPLASARVAPSRGHRSSTTTTTDKAVVPDLKSSPTKLQPLPQPQLQSPSQPQSTLHNRDEIRGAYRKQSIRAIRDANGDVDAFLEELDAKRRALDEQIHRYIKQKEREFKFFERDARIKYRNAGARHNPDGTLALPSDLDRSSSSGSATQSRAQRRADDNNLKDVHVTRERDADLLGVFTPNYLTLLKADSESAKGRAPTGADPASAPPIAGPLDVLELPLDQRLLRSNSDPVDDKQIARPVRARLSSRTSSSGSESKNLVSALKSQLSNAKVPKRKRVSLVVGDEVVAPNDSVPEDDDQDERADQVEAAAGAPKTHRELRLRHSLHRAKTGVNTAIGDSADTRRISVQLDERSEAHREPEPEAQAEAGADPVFRPTDFNQRQESELASAIAAHRAQTEPQPIETHASPKTSEPHVFSFSDNELGQDENSDRHARSDGEDASASHASLSQPLPPAINPSAARLVGTDPIPSLPAQTISASRPVPSQRTLSSASQSSLPGYTKPNVTADPILQLDSGSGMQTPEIERNSEFGSLSSSYSLLDRTGSLGESFMERNAAELRRTGRRRTSAAAAS